MKKQTKEVLKKRKNDLSIIDFQDKFNTDDACREYLFKLKWSNGFVCVNCGHKEYYFIKGRNLYQCTKCKKQHSVIAGTLFQDTHVDLRKWFWAIYLVSRDKRGLSAIGLKNAINVSYPTAWAMLNKIRQAMGSLESDYLLKELIIADNFFLKNSSKEKKHSCAKENPPISVAISLDEEKKLHLVKMTIIENIQKEIIKDHINLTIKPDSIPNGDSHKILAEFKDFKHSNINASQNNKETKNIFLPWLKIIINNAKTFILGTYHGLPKKHLQHYLDEFCYRLNRRFCESTIFNKLIYTCLIFSPVTITASSL